ncbi:MAG: glycosyltransferase, partial [Patescibacteria group bacterium]
MIRVGFECEQLEGNRFGVGHTLAQLLEVFAQIPEIEKQFRFVLHFKKEIPKDNFLSHPVFEKRILTRGIIPPSFNVFYHILIPIAYWRDKLDLYFFPSYMLPAFFVGKSIVVLTNDVYWEAHHSNLPFKYRLAYRLFCWWAAKRADKILTISEFSASELRKFYNISREKIFVNSWGLEKIFQELPKDEKYLSEIQKIKIQFGIENKFFLSIGQAFPRRHIKEAMLAFASIANQYSDTQYLVTATDKYEPPILENLVKEINQKAGRRAIIYVKYLDRKILPHLMNETLALIYVSDKEALGLPPLEALACGRPAIVKDNEISRELFGEQGYFVADTNNPRTQRAEQSPYDGNPRT